MARKLAGVVFAVSTMHVSIVQALGLGEIDMKSSMNQPLRAEIALLNTAGIEQSQLSVRLAGQEAYVQAGVERVFFLNDMTFTVQLDNAGGGVINVASEKPVREPFIDFVLEARWPEGQLVREYTLLVDLPEFADGAVVASVPAAGATSAARIAQPTPAPASRQTARSGQVVTRPSDTLWEIAARVKPRAVNMQQAMMALLERNPDAFDDRNINRLRKGQTLHLPGDGEYRALTPNQAIAAVAEQNAAWRASQPGAGGATARTAAADESYMKLSGAGAAEAGPDTQTDGAQAPVAGSPPQVEVEALRSKITVAEERLDSAERDNVEMNERLGELEQQIDTLMQLVELKNQQLAGLQASTPAAAVTPVTDGAIEASEPVQALSAGGAAALAATAPAVVAGSAAKDPSQSPVPVLAVDQNFPAESPVVVAPDVNMETVESEGVTLSGPLLWSAAGGLGLILAGGGLVAHRRRREEAEVLAAEEAIVAQEARASLRARAVGATAEAGSVVDPEALLANDENSEPLFDIQDAPETLEASSLDGADPMMQAEAWCNQGEHDKAIELLQQSIVDEPNSSEMRLQLLGVLAELGREQEFTDAFSSLELVDSDSAFMARHLVADKGWLEGQGNTGAVAAAPAATDLAAALADKVDGDVSGEFDLDLELDLDLGDTDSASQDSGLDLDLKLNLDELDSSTLGLDADSLGELPTDSELKLDLDLFDAEAGNSEVDLGVDLGLGLAKDEALEEAGDLVSLLDTGKDLDDEMQGMLDGDAISTKLDLAKAYVDMGDADGARDILEEVLSEGSDGQKNEANELLQALAS